MKYVSHILTTATMALGLSTSLGVFLHDTNVDKAVISAWRVMKDAYQVDDDHRSKPHSSPHTHSDHHDFSGALKDGQTHPRTTPRSADRKHIHTKLVSRGGDGDIDGHRLMVDPISVS